MKFEEVCISKQDYKLLKQYSKHKQLISCETDIPERLMKYGLVGRKYERSSTKNKYASTNYFEITPKGAEYLDWYKITHRADRRKNIWLQLVIGTATIALATLLTQFLQKLFQSLIK